MIYHCAPGIVWVKEADHLLLIDRETGQSWTLYDTGALIWEWLTLGYAAPKLITLLALVLSVQESEAAALLTDALQSWQNQTILYVT